MTFFKQKNVYSDRKLLALFKKMYDNQINIILKQFNQLERRRLIRLETVKIQKIDNFHLTKN